MRSADATERAAGQRLKHWGSHVSPGAKPQHHSRPPAHTSKNGSFELPTQGSQKRLSEASVPLWILDPGLPAAQELLAQQSLLFMVGAGMEAPDRGEGGPLKVLAGD